MAKWFMVVETNCADKAREAEFNKWYEKTHIPDVFQTPGFFRVTRYENIQPAEGQAKYLAIYEIETDDINKFSQIHAADMDKKRAAGRFSELLQSVKLGYYRQISSRTR